ARQALYGWILVDGDCGAAFADNPLDLLQGPSHVPRRQNRARDEATGVGAAPLIDVPVVVGAQVNQRLALVRGLVKLTAVETNTAGEVQRGGDAVDVHVIDAGVGLIDASAQLLQGGRLHAVFLQNASNDGVQADGGHLHPLVFPVVRAVLG